MMNALFLSTMLAGGLAWSAVAVAQTTTPPTGNEGAVDAGAAARSEQATAEAEPDLAYPRVTYGVSVELENDWTFDSTDPAAEINDLYPTVETALALEFAEGSGLFSTLVLEPVLDPVDDRAFEDLGLYAEELFAQITLGGVALRAGKFDPAFGAAFDTAPGIFGTSFAEDYELTERLGAGVAVPFEAYGGEHTLSGALFRADRSIFSNSLFTERGNLDESDGGPSNTDAPESFAIALDGAFDKTTYVVAYNAGIRYQQGGEGSPGDELGFVLGMSWTGEVGPGELGLMAETAYLNEAEATRDNAAYVTLGAAYGIDRFTVSGVYAIRDFDNASADNLATATVEYEILDGLSAGVGYAYANEGGENSHTLGVLVAYEFGGGFSFLTD